MRVAIAGSSGFIGTALTATLRANGHDVLRLVRREPAGPDEAQWDPAAGAIDAADLEGVEAVVNLAGAGVGEHRWNRTYKQVLHDSRIRSTTVLAAAIAGLPERPRVFVSTSAMGYYGPDRGHDIVDEDDEPGEGFLAGLCQEWEEAAAPARNADIAVCHPRFGLVMDRSGGAMERMLPLFRVGLGGTLGGGEQYWSMISLHDVTRALTFLIEEHGCVGPYNVTAPEPVTNAEFTRILADVLHRPRFAPVPAFALRIALGEYAEEIISSLRVVPTRLLGAGFVHDHPTPRAIAEAAVKPLGKSAGKAELAGPASSTETTLADPPTD